MGVESGKGGAALPPDRRPFRLTAPAPPSTWRRNLGMAAVTLVFIGTLVAMPSTGLSGLVGSASQHLTIASLPVSAAAAQPSSSDTNGSVDGHGSSTDDGIVGASTSTGGADASEGSSAGAAQSAGASGEGIAAAQRGSSNSSSGSEETEEAEEGSRGSGSSAEAIEEAEEGRSSSSKEAKQVAEADSGSGSKEATEATVEGSSSGSSSAEGTVAAKEGGGSDEAAEADEESVGGSAGDEADLPCRESGYCSVGKLQAYVGEVDSTEGFRAMVS